MILNALDATSITSRKNVIQAFMDNEEIFVGLFRHAESLYGESIPKPRIVNRQVNRANPLAVSPLQFFRRFVFLPFIDTVLEQLSEIFRSDLVDCIKLQLLIPSVTAKHGISSIRNAVNFSIFPLLVIALTRQRLILCNGVHIGYATKMILYRTTLLAGCCLLKKNIRIHLW